MLQPRGSLVAVFVLQKGVFLSLGSLSTNTAISLVLTSEPSSSEFMSAQYTLCKNTHDYVPERLLKFYADLYLCPPRHHPDRLPEQTSLES